MVAGMVLIADEIIDQPMVVLTTPAPINAKREPASGMANEDPVRGVTRPSTTVLAIETTSMADTPLREGLFIDSLISIMYPE